MMTIRALEQGWVLETKSTGYSFGVNKAGLLAHSYWGKKLPYLQDYPQPADSEGWASFNGAAHVTPEEYPAYAGTSYVDPCLKATFADGVRDVVLRFESAQTRQVDVPELDIYLADVHYPFKVTLHYRVHAAHDLIERWAT
ncbi:MAG: alpha-galactosidase, partial [Chitinophagaceae bacterium]|nr:alpha-galactosidase [Anaerolineae bacterium]